MSLNHALITLTIVPVLSHITYVNQSDVSFHESMHDWQHLTPPQSTLPWLQVRLHLRGFSVPFSVSLPTSPLTAHIAKTSISTYRIDAGLIWEGMCVVVCQVLWNLIFHLICPLQDRAKSRIVKTCGARCLTTIPHWIAEKLAVHRWIHEMLWCRPTINIQRNVLFMCTHQYPNVRRWL